MNRFVGLLHKPEQLKAAFKEHAFEKHLNCTDERIEALSICKSERICYYPKTNTALYSYKQLRTKPILYAFVPLLIIAMWYFQQSIWFEVEPQIALFPLFVILVLYLIVFYEKTIFISSEAIKIRIHFFPFFYTKVIKLTKSDTLHYFKSHNKERSKFSDQAFILLGNKGKKSYKNLCSKVYRSSAYFDNSNSIRKLVYYDFLASVFAMASRRSLRGEPRFSNPLGNIIVWTVRGLMVLTIVIGLIVEATQ